MGARHDTASSVQQQQILLGRLYLQRRPAYLPMPSMPMLTRTSSILAVATRRLTLVMLVSAALHAHIERPSAFPAGSSCATGMCTI